MRWIKDSRTAPLCCLDPKTKHNRRVHQSDTQCRFVGIDPRTKRGSRSAPNVEYLLDSVQASTMVSNSEFVVMLNQAAKDREKLAKLLNISNEQMSYVTNADAGCGLIRYGRALVPFINRFPKGTELYKLMTTRPGEGVFGVGRNG